MSTKVLVFESDPAFAGELRNELGKLGCSTVVVDDGNVGLQQAASAKPDLILLSIELPRMNGFSVCNKLKKDANLKDVPLIIMSSESSDETFEQHKKLRTRAEDYIHKPIAFGELLQHIQSFVAIGSPAHVSEAPIVIDDEIEIGSADYYPDDEGTVIAPRPAGMPNPGTPVSIRAAEKVDDDVDAFADAAFGRLTGADARVDAPGAVAEARPIHNGAPEPAAPPPPAPRRASVVPVQRPQSVRPSPAVDPADHEKLRVELEAARGRLTGLETDLREARDEAEKWRMEGGETERLRREVEELKTKLASGPKAGGISSREFLDLREALNKKDKEILSLREQQSKKDREIVEAQDRMLVLERSKSDLDDRALSLERELGETKEKNESLAADKDLAKKAGEDLKVRLEKSRAESEAKDRQLAELRVRLTEEAAAADGKLSALQADYDQILANERADHARALDQAEERRRSDLDQATRDRDGALSEAKEQADREKQDALSAQAAQLKTDHDGKMAALHRGHQQELERSVAATRKEGENATAAALESLRGEHAAKVESLEADQAERVLSLENDRDSRIAALESKGARELGEANEKLAKVDMDLSATRGELSALREEKDAGDAAAATKLAELKSSLTETTSERDTAQSKLAAATERNALLEAEGASAQQELAETRQKLAAESSRADKAHAKWESDRQSLERAKDALAVALSQIEEAEGRPIS